MASPKDIVWIKIGHRAPTLRLSCYSKSGELAGYVIFGFPEKNLYVLESGFYGNATYVVTDDWEVLSRMTKAELINGDLHQTRVVHLKSWSYEIRQLLT